MKYSHDEFKGDLMSLIRDIAHRGFKPNAVAGIVRGGLVPATYLAQWYGVTVLPIRCSYRDNVEPVNCNEVVQAIKQGQNILIVDDIVDSGDTMADVIETLIEQVGEPAFSSQVRVASLFLNTAQDLVEIDFWAREINRSEDDTWIVFEFEEFWR